MSDEDEVLQLIGRLEGTAVADLNSLVQWAGDFEGRHAKRVDLGGLNFTLCLVALVACEVFGFLTTGAALHRARSRRSSPDVGPYIMRFIQNFFPRSSPFRRMEKVLADFLRHDLVHGFGSANPGAPFELDIFIRKQTSNPLLAGYTEAGTKLLKINAVALARDTVAGFYELKRRIRAGKDTQLLANILLSRQVRLPVSPGAARQFEVLHRGLERQATKARCTAGSHR